MLLLYTILLYTYSDRFSEESYDKFIQKYMEQKVSVSWVVFCLKSSIDYHFSYWFNYYLFPTFSFLNKIIVQNVGKMQRIVEHVL